MARCVTSTVTASRTSGLANEFLFSYWQTDNVPFCQVCCYNFLGLTLSSSTSGRNACLSEEVTLTCTAQGEAVFWGNEEFGEITMHFQSAPSRGQFRAIVVDYDNQRKCLVSSLTFRATASRNGTRVTCTSRDRNSYETLSLHIIPSEPTQFCTCVPAVFT